MWHLSLQDLHNRMVQDRTGQGRGERDRAGQGRTGQEGTGHDKTGWKWRGRDGRRGEDRPLGDVPTQSLVDMATLFPQYSENVCKVKTNHSDVIRIKDTFIQISSVKDSVGQDEAWSSPGFSSMMFRASMAAAASMGGSEAEKQ